METNSLTVKSAGFHRKRAGNGYYIRKKCKNIFLLHNLGLTEIKCLEVQNVKNMKNSFGVSAQSCKILDRNWGKK